MKQEIKLSKQFRSQATKSIIAILLFMMTYALILVMALGLTVVCVYAGVMLIILKPMFITIGLGIGFASLGFLILVFLLKFAFSSQKTDLSHLSEINKAQEPKLFALIDELVKEVGTQFPKRVYLSAEVNASVFYDSSFWSMLFPVRKNLQIGLGLVNSITETELKAILAHEFGHFSQKTMKVGSYVYNVNQVIFNMLNNNESYDRMIHKWAEISGYFSFFVVIAIKIISGIQWILMKLYGVVNKSYLGLSREMEFHADEIAAHVTGYKPLKSALLRMDLTDYAFNAVLGFYESKIAQNLKSQDLYKEHSFVMNFLANDHNLSLENDLPKVTIETLDKFNKSKLVIKDQWASHPSTEERIERLERTSIKTIGTSNKLAQELFVDINGTQKTLTDKMFKEVKYEGEVSSMSLDQFQKDYKKEFTDNTFSKCYNGYYDSKNPVLFEIPQGDLTNNTIALEDLFSHKNVDMVYSNVALQNDIEMIVQISTKVIPVKTFDYDGKKYKRKEIKSLLPTLKSELEKSTQQIKENDIRIFEFFTSKEIRNGEEPRLKSLYQEFFAFDKIFDDKYSIYSKLNEQLDFINFTTPFDQIVTNFRSIEILENQLKDEIKALLVDSTYQVEITKEIKENFELYISKEWKYFANEQYYDKSLEVLFTAMNNYAYLLSRGFFLIKKKLMNYQEEIING